MPSFTPTCAGYSRRGGAGRAWSFAGAFALFHGVLGAMMETGFVVCGLILAPPV